jgi:type I restriction enzyme S subunit
MTYSSKDKWIDRDLSEVYWFQEGPGVRNWQFTSSGIKLLNVANITKLGTIDLNKTERCLSEEEVEKKYKHFLVDIGDLVIASSGISFDTDGLLRTRGAFVQKEHLPLCMNTSTIRFKAKEGVSDLNFLKFWLDSYEFREQITRLVTGSAQQNFGPSHLKSIQIKLPPLREQKRIAAIAQKADRLRRTRRYALQLSDTYLQSVFLEMFGDARTNPNNFPTEPLGDSLEKFESGVNFNPVSEREPASQWRVLKVSAVTSGVFEPYESKPIKPDVTFNDTLVVKKGDLLMSRANTRELVGAICMVREQPPKVLLPDKLWRVKFSKHSKLEPNYVLYALRQPKLRKIIADMASGTSGSMKNISKEQAATLPILIPPFALQEKFSQIVHKSERFRTQQREAERQAEHLFQTLLHRAFRGELTPQVANDEPASVLLEKINAESEKLGTRKNE